MDSQLSGGQADSPSLRPEIDANMMADLNEQLRSVDAEKLSPLSVSVIVPFRRDCPQLRATCQAILAMDPPADELILVMDGPSQPPQLPPVTEAGSKVPWTLVQLSHNSGPAAARNAGALKACSKVLLFVDADVVVPPETLRLLRDFFREGGRAVIALFTSVAPLTRISARYKNHYMRASYLRFAEGEPVPAFLTSAAACLREDFGRIGGFDEAYRTPSVEDADFGRSLAAIGVRVSLIPEWQVIHCHDYSLRELLWTGFRRAAAVIRLSLRRKDSSPHHGRTSPIGYRLSLPISLAACLVGFPGLCLGSVWACSLSLGLVALIYVFNLPLLNYYFGESERLTAVFAVLFLPLDLLIHSVGILWGILSFYGGSRH
jgi:GT2 family glycosyltransferase